MRIEGGAGRDQVTQDQIFLQADQPVHIAGQRGFGENLGGFLDAGSADEAFA